MKGFPGHSLDGTTLIEDDDKFGLLIKITTRGQLNIAEGENLDKAFLKYINPRRRLSAKTILKVSFAKKFHKECFGDVWEWAGEFRNVATNPGIEWQHIQKELDLLIKNIQTQLGFITDQSDVAQKEKIIAAFSHKLVYIHPFRNGNGRWSRGYADLLADVLNINRFSWGSSIKSESERQLEMVNALKLADTTNNIEPFLEWAKK